MISRFFNGCKNKHITETMNNGIPVQLVICSNVDNTLIWDEDETIINYLIRLETSTIDSTCIKSKSIKQIMQIAVIKKASINNPILIKDWDTGLFFLNAQKPSDIIYTAINSNPSVLDKNPKQEKTLIKSKLNIL